jgi:small GTP-binding protein
MSSAKKIVILGQFGVGKTSLTRRFVDKAFSEDYLVTLGVQIKKKTLTLKNGEESSLIIWDIEGTRSVIDTRASYLLGSHAIIYVFDATRVETYQNLAEELEHLKQHNIPIKVLANKSDLADTKSVLSFLGQHNLTVNYFTSAKSGENVDKVFNELANELGV